VCGRGGEYQIDQMFRAALDIREPWPQETFSPSIALPMDLQSMLSEHAFDFVRPIAHAGRPIRRSR
jgi:hypothetical protein